MALRKWLVDATGLWAVVSLPSHVFHPYSGVKTSILFIDRKIARGGDEIILLRWSMTVIPSIPIGRR
ncbi:MAG TPA: hypothetical protein DDY22_14580 [Geobacter sp.]|nr:hypothetical protein [Geobacter sp.]